MITAVVLTILAVGMIAVGIGVAVMAVTMVREDIFSTSAVNAVVGSVIVVTGTSMGVLFVVFAVWMLADVWRLT